MIWEDNSVSRKPLDHNTAADDDAGSTTCTASTC